MVNKCEPSNVRSNRVSIAFSAGQTNRRQPVRLGYWLFLSLTLIGMVVLGYAVSHPALYAASGRATNVTSIRAFPAGNLAMNSLQTSIAAGWTHTCVINASGGVQCWGSNAFGQLGDGTQNSSSTPVAVVGLSSGVEAIAAGETHVCALTDGGGVKCWGLNDYGELGDGTKRTSRLTPVDVVGLSSGVSAIAANNLFSCALTSSGGMKCWGSNGSGQLGDGSKTERLTPVDVTGLTSGVRAIALGGYHACALTNAGGVKCWGNNIEGQLGDDSKTDRLTAVDVVGLSSGVEQVSAGKFHTCALLANGGVKCWGNDRLTPTDVPTASGGRALAAGGNHTCLLTTSGGLGCWGTNASGQLGNGSYVFTDTVTTVTGLASGVSAVSAGENHTCALTSSGGVKCWGINSSRELGNDMRTDQRDQPGDVVGLSSGMSSLALGAHHSCALTNGGGVKCWGYIDRSLRSPIPFDMPTLNSGITMIASGNSYFCVLTSSGGVKCQGNNFAGQLGNGTTASSGSPVDVTGLASGITALTAGNMHTCALTSGGGVKCWGDNLLGQLGDGTTTRSSTPLDVVGLSSGVRAIAASVDHTCALTTSNGVKCWGATTGSNTPIDIAGLSSGVNALSLGSVHSCALTTSGGIKCWGMNDYGQLGDGTQTERSAPVDVSGLGSGVSALASGWSHTCALTNGGGAKCWGYNAAGQLGDGSIVTRTLPVDVMGLTSNVIALASGSSHTCALTSSGGIKCWGGNDSGQLGVGNGIATPVDVLNLSVATPTPGPTLTPTTPTPAATIPITTTPGPTPGQSPTPATTPTPAASETTTAQLAPNSGATLDLNNNAINLQFPAGAVGSNTIITATKANTAQQPTGNFSFAGKAFTVIATDASGAPVTTFSQPYTLTVNYSDSDWQTAGIANEEDINLYFWNGSTWTPILPCSGCTHDTAGNRIVALLDHLTEFALLGKQSGHKVHLPLVQR